MKKTLLLFVITLLSTLTVSATYSNYPVEIDDIYYYLDYDNKIAMVASGSYSGHVTIPSFIKDRTNEDDIRTYNVVAIGYHAFYNCSDLTSVKIPSSITYIGESAFDGCTGLASVYITDIEAWCKINFHNLYSSPLSYAKHLYMDKRFSNSQ